MVTNVRHSASKDCSPIVSHGINQLMQEPSLFLLHQLILCTPKPQIVIVILLGPN